MSEFVLRGFCQEKAAKLPFLRFFVFVKLQTDGRFPEHRWIVGEVEDKFAVVDKADAVSGHEDLDAVPKPVCVSSRSVLSISSIIAV